MSAMSFPNEKIDVVVCLHLTRGGRPVRLATHYTGGDWAFTCGRPDHSAEEDYELVSLSTLLAKDPDLSDIAELPEGWSADRGGEPLEWFRYEDPEADE